MQFYWSINQIPELAGLTQQQIKEAWQFCYKKYAFKHWEVWVSLFVLGVLVAIGSGLFRVIGAAIGGGLGGLIFGLTTSNVLRPHLHDYVSTHFTNVNLSVNSSTEEISEDSSNVNLTD
jgi:hypothetical protein